MDTHIFARVDDFLSTTFGLEDDILKLVEESIRKNGMPEHSVSATQGQLLFFLAKACQAKRIIEVGTLGGYSAIWLARALPEGGKITTIEIDERFAQVAKANIGRAGLDDKVDVIVGEALKVLDTPECNDAPVDLFFMDADKPNYVNYFNWALKRSRPGSMIIADNVIREGKVLSADSEDEKVVGVRNYLHMLANEKCVTTSILQTVGHKEHDGIALSLVE